MVPVSVAVTGLVVGVVVLCTAVPAAPAVPRPTPGALAPGQRARLAAAHAFTTSPIRFLLLGDSIALTLGLGLSVDTRPSFGVHLYDKAVIGCDLDPTLEVNLSGQVGPATPGCRDWPSVWASDVQVKRPDVVGILLGRWEVADHLYDGRWTHIGEPLWDDHLARELSQAIGIVSAGGARVVLFTMPYVDPAVESPAGVPFSENQPARVVAFNALVRRVAARHPPVTVIDLNRMLDPDGHYTATVDGIVVRSTDGIHISDAGGEWLRPRIDPTVAALGLEAERAHPVTLGADAP
jgi:hypothetical protein